MPTWPLGVFASIDAGLGVHLEVAHELGVPTIQLHTPSAASRTPARAREFLARVTGLGMRITVVFGGFEGESYADIPTVKRTVGLVPPETRAARVKEMKEIADFARLLGVDVVGLHIGFVPHDARDPDYGQLIAVARDLCDHCKAHSQPVHLETGQESADTLLEVSRRCRLRQPVHELRSGEHDPLRFGRSDRRLEEDRPLRPQRPLQGRQVGRPARRGVGRRNAAGQGRRRHGAVPSHAEGNRLHGPLTIEREIPQEPERQKQEIGAGLKLLEEIKQRLGCGSG